MLTIEVAEGQAPLETTHAKELVPVLSELTWEEKLVLEIMAPDPEITDQLPVPTLGCTADKVAEVLQSV
jgi:hypothetical protein